ncbi:MAG: hypothetical protein ACXWT2_09845 [Methylovulum sp.]
MQEYLWGKASRLIACGWIYAASRVGRLMVFFITVAAKALDLNYLQPEVSIKCPAL